MGIELQPSYLLYCNETHGCLGYCAKDWNRQTGSCIFVKADMVLHIDNLTIQTGSVETELGFESSFATVPVVAYDWCDDALDALPEKVTPNTCAKGG